MLNFVDSHNSPLRSAHLFRQMGWSFLPLWGSIKPEKAKVSAIPSWKIYQSRIPTDYEINEWFAIKKYQALGIVLGSISQLVVLDIDDPQWDRLVQQYRVTGIPQYTFLDESQETLDTVVGKVPQSIMERFFEQLVS